MVFFSPWVRIINTSFIFSICFIFYISQPFDRIVALLSLGLNRSADLIPNRFFSWTLSSWSQCGCLSSGLSAELFSLELPSHLPCKFSSWTLVSSVPWLFCSVVEERKHASEAKVSFSPLFLRNCPFFFPHTWWISWLDSRLKTPLPLFSSLYSCL